MEAVKAGLRARDRGVPTDLLEEIQGFWGLGTLGELIAKANHSKRTNFAELTTVVASGAEHGDPVALRVLERAGEDLAEQVFLVVRKMRTVRCEPGDVSRVAFTGSVLGKISPVREAMTARLAELVPEMVVSPTEVNALEGALWIARSRG